MSKQAYQESPSEKTRRKYRKFLSEDEELVLVTGFSRMQLRNRFAFYILWPGGVFLALGVWLGYYLKLDLGFGLLIGLFFACVIGFLRTHALNLANKYIFTTRRVIIRRGLLSIKLSSALYDKITHIEVDQSFIDRIVLNHGTIIVNTAGSNKDELIIRYVEAPLQLKNLLERLINREREQFGRSSGPVVSLEGEIVE